MIHQTTKWCAALLLTTSLITRTGYSVTNIETGFSPEGSAQKLVLKTISSARRNIHLMGYSFTSPQIAKALVTAHKRGVEVKVVLDEKGNRQRTNWAAMDLLVSAGIPVRTINRYDIMHDKVIIVDGTTVETGSFNYSHAAAHHNSENVLVLHDVPDIARQYLAHWQSRWDQGHDWKLGY